MDALPRTVTPESSASDPGKWIGRVLIAVLLGEGIWGLIVSLTNNLVLPLLARTMGADAQSPLYLGKGDFNVPALFTSVLELCFAAIVAVVLNSWVGRKPRLTRSKPVRMSPIPAQPGAPAASPQSGVPVQAAASPSSEQFWSPPEPSQPKTGAPAPPPPTVKPAKPTPPKEVYYNIVGEPINPTEDE
jgi:hypothetical protein